MVHVALVKHWECFPVLWDLDNQDLCHSMPQHLLKLVWFLPLPLPPPPSLQSIQLTALCFARAGVIAATAGDSSRLLLQASAPASSVVPTNLFNLTASEVVPLLCNRTITAVEYVHALFDYYDQGAFACLNSFISFNQTKVGHGRKECTHGTLPDTFPA